MRLGDFTTKRTVAQRLCLREFGRLEIIYRVGLFLEGLTYRSHDSSPHASTSIALTSPLIARRSTFPGRQIPGLPADLSFAKGVGERFGDELRAVAGWPCGAGANGRNNLGPLPK